MLKPRRSNTAITHFISRQFFQYLHFSTGMAEHIHKIIYDHIDVIVQEVMDIIYKVKTSLVVQNFCIGTPEIFNQHKEQRCSLFYVREHLKLEQRMAHYRAICTFWVHPRSVIS